jgi:hypothetical protein
VRFHLADQEMRPSGKVSFGSLACMAISTRPGKIATGENQIVIAGQPGQEVLRTLNYLDPIPNPVGLDPALMSIGIDLLTAYYTHPFNDPPAGAEYDWSVGGC